MRTHEESKRILESFSRKRRTPVTRPLGGQAFMQQNRALDAQINQHHVDAVVRGGKENANRNTIPRVDAAVRGGNEDENRNTIPRVDAAIRDIDEEGENDQAPEKSNAKRFGWMMAAGLVTAIILIIALVLGLTAGQRPPTSKAAESLGNHDDSLPSLRLNKAVNLSGLQCVVGRLLPLSNSPPSTVTKDPASISELFYMVEELSAVEQKLVSALQRLHTRVAALQQRRVEITTAPHNQSPDFRARAKAIRDSEALVTQIKNTRHKITQLLGDINKQTENLIPRITAKADGLCEKIRGSALTDIYRTQIWVDPSEATSAEAHQVLVHQTFCSTIRSLHNSRPKNPTPGTPQSAAEEAEALLHELKLLEPKAGEALKNFQSGCNFLCSMVWYLNEVRWGPAADSPSK